MVDLHIAAVARWAAHRASAAPRTNPVGAHPRVALVVERAASSDARDLTHLRLEGAEEPRRTGRLIGACPRADPLHTDGVAAVEVTLARAPGRDQLTDPHRSVTEVARWAGRVVGARTATNPVQTVPTRTRQVVFAAHANFVEQARAVGAIPALRAVKIGVALTGA
uniref:Uncharacterized protein n=1 Tax=uncultured bacterium HF186_25m_27D22 TaxID=662889 RepID=C7FPJ0_9BACT|nr:hypothetical protein [uncultured bacterium HF186_25m_27D22]